MRCSRFIDYRHRDSAHLSGACARRSPKSTHWCASRRMPHRPVAPKAVLLAMEHFPAEPGSGRGNLSSPGGARSKRQAFHPRPAPRHDRNSALATAVFCNGNSEERCACRHSCGSSSDPGTANCRAWLTIPPGPQRRCVERGGLQYRCLFGDTCWPTGDVKRRDLSTAQNGSKAQG